MNYKLSCQELKYIITRKVLVLIVFFSLILNFCTIAIHSDFSFVLCCHITQSLIFIFLSMLITAEFLFQLVINTQNFFLSYFFSDFMSKLLNKFLCLLSKQFLKSSHFFSFTFSYHVNSEWCLNYFNYSAAHFEVSQHSSINWLLFQTWRAWSNECLHWINLHVRLIRIWKSFFTS